jgi:hypothetical protein
MAELVEHKQRVVAGAAEMHDGPIRPIDRIEVPEPGLLPLACLLLCPAHFDPSALVPARPAPAAVQHSGGFFEGR